MRIWVLVFLFAIWIKVEAGISFLDTLREDHESIDSTSAVVKDHKEEKRPGGGLSELLDELSKGSAKVEWRHCGSTHNETIIIDDLNWLPNPIEIPGKIMLGFKMQVRQRLTGPLKLEVEMKKKVSMLFGMETWVPVPCHENGLGSCTIDDLCESKFLNGDRPCPPAFRQQNIPCKCPVEQGLYTLPPVEHEVPDAPDDIDPLFMDGDFNTKFTFTEKGKHLACIETDMTVKL